MAGRAVAQRISELPDRRCGQYSAVLHPAEVECTGQEHSVRRLLRHGPPQLRGRVHPERARLRGVRAEGRPRGHRGRALARAIISVKKLKPAPRLFRDELPPNYPEPLPPYKVPTLLEEYRVLAIVFGIVALALTAYFIKSILTAPPPPPPVQQSVYIEAVQPSAPVLPSAPAKP